MSTIFEIKHLSGSLAGQSQRIALSEGQVIRLGRKPESDVKFSDTVDDAVSGVHAELVWQGGRLYVEDKKSSNGTFVNGAKCPPFEKLAVPDGSRIRLAQGGPEMQVTFEPAAAAASPAAGATAQAPDANRSSMPPKEAVGRQTLLREIDRAKQEERDRMVSEVARSRKSTGVWLAVATAALLFVVLVGVGVTYWLGQKKVDQTADQLAGTQADLEQRLTDEVGKNVWQEIEGRVRPAIGHIRLRYHLIQPQLRGDDTVVPIEVHTKEIAGSAVLIKPDLVMTAKHVAEPWKYLADWPKTQFQDWDDFAEKNNLKPVYELLEIQFPGRQAISATHQASAETSDLALLSIPEVAIEPIEVELSNDAINVTDEIAIIGYPYSLGETEVTARDVSYGQSFLTQIRDMEPTFMKGTVSRPVAEIGDTSRYFFIDSSIERGNSGGPVLNREGKVVGIISMGLEIEEVFEFQGQQLPRRQEVESAGRAVSPGDIAHFLKRAGVL